MSARSLPTSWSDIEQPVNSSQPSSSILGESPALPPTVTIVTPSYNQAEYLEETLRSVLDQQGVSLEYLVVDGGSLDGSREIIEQYAQASPRASEPSSQASERSLRAIDWWVSEADAGQAEAINKGLRRARGEIVAWLNSDDLYLPGAVAQAVQALQAHPEAGLVYGDALTIDAQGQPLNTLRFGEWGLAELMRFRIICQPAVFMRRVVLEKAGYLDASYHFLLDHHLWLRMARLAPIRHVPAVWAAARHHPQAKNVAQAAGFGQEAFRILEWMQTQPDLAPQLSAQPPADGRRHILAGAYRLQARYLLDGGQPGPALRSYLQALRYSPRFALQHAHRMAYAFASWLAAPLPGGKQLLSWLERRRWSQRRP